MIKLNVDCSFTKPYGATTAEITPQLDYQPIESEISQEKGSVNQILGDQLKEIVQNHKDTSDRILKTQEAIKLQLIEISNELNKISINTQNCLKNIEKIVIDNNIIRDQLGALRLDGGNTVDNNEKPIGKDELEFKEVSSVGFDTLHEQEKGKQELKVHDKGTQVDGEIDNACISSNTLEQGGKVIVNKNEIDELTSKTSHCERVVKCCYCDESHIQIIIKTQKPREESRDQQRRETVVDNNPKRSSLNTGLISKTWPRNKHTSCAINNSLINGKTSVQENTFAGNINNKQQHGRNKQNLAIETERGFKADIESEQHQPEELKESGIEIPQSLGEVSNQNDNNANDKLQADQTKCKVCKSVSCNLNKLPSKKYSHRSLFNCSKNEGLGKCDSVSIKSLRNSCHQFSNQRVLSSTSVSIEKSIKPQPLNVANDLFKSHLKNCKVHGCIALERPSESFQGSSCHVQKFSQNRGKDHQSVNNKSCSGVLLAEMETIKKENCKVMLSGSKCKEDENVEDTCFHQNKYKDRNEIRETLEEKTDCSTNNFNNEYLLNEKSNLVEEGQGNKSSNGIFLQSKRKVLALAQEAKRSKEYKFMWSRGGKVFMKKEENSPIVTISNMSDLKSL